MSSLHIASRTPSPILFALPLCLFCLCLANAQDIPLSPPDDAPFESSAAPTRSVGPRGLAPPTSALKAPPDIGGGVWLAEGPGPAIFGQVEGITPGPSEVVGAVHVIAAHPSDTNILYVGGANGGLWKTTNAQDVSPFWTPLTDDKASLSMSALEFDPTDGTNQTLVAGIGRYSSFSDRSGGLRTGLLKTTDGGTTWAAIDGGGVLTGLNISGVAPRGTIIVVSANDADVASCADVGIWRSTDGGATFVKLSAGAGVPDGEAFDLASDALSSSTLYTGIAFGSFCGALPNGVYKSTDTGATWTKVSTASMDSFIVDDVTDNIEIAARGPHVYVDIILDGRPVGIFHSADGGSSFAAMDLPRTPEGLLAAIGTVTPGTPVSIDTTPNNHGFTEDAEEVQILGVMGPAINGTWTTMKTGDFTFDLEGSSDATAWTPGTGTWQKVVGLSPRRKPGSQGGIHASIVIDPSDPTQVAVGGDRQDGPFPNYLGAGDFTGRLFRGDTTVAPTGAIPSPQWEHLTHSDSVAAIPDGGTLGDSAPHADSREMVWEANQENIIQVDDGGVYRRSLARLNTGDWVSINGNLQVNEQHDVAYDSVSDIIISGNQDTGTTQQMTPHGLTWLSVSTADGGDVAVDDISVPGASTRYSSFQYLIAFVRREYDASNGLMSNTAPSLAPMGALTPTPQFVTPVVLNANVPTRLLIGACNAIFESLDRGDTIMEIAGLTGCPENAITYGGFSGGVPDPDTIWAAVSADVYQRVGAGGAFSLKAAYPGGTVTDIVVDPTDTSTAYVVDATHVYQTHDGGTSWTDITGNLTDTQLQSTVIDPGPAARIFVGGREGVFELTLPAPGVPAACAPGCTWGELGGGSLPNAPVWDMEWDVADSKLVVGTLGRGAWTFQENGTCGFPKNMVVNNRMISTASLFKACNTISGGPALTVDATGPGSVDFVAGISVAIGNGTVLGGAGGVTVEIDSSLVSP